MFHSLPEPVTQLMNGKLPADHPGAGIFRPVCDTLQNGGDSNSPPKMMTRVVWS